MSQGTGYRTPTMKRLAKTVAAQFPLSLQQELKRLYFARQIGRGTFQTDEREFDLLDSFLSPGDWALDIGANVGQYTKRLSDLVGANGRVIAFEPVPATFELLAANVRKFSFANVTLLNVAASDVGAVIGMDLPLFDTGLINYYQAHLSNITTALSVFCVPIDTLPLTSPVRLVKIDAEGHELSVLRGMQGLLQRDRPILIVETTTTTTQQFLRDFNYHATQIQGSSNQIFRA